ncbi:patatin-like phospholipase family protein (plasmid) [Streptomyces sp. CA-294286]|uniref:patatin-like phospholipase family protein n=1 Tax=Streptomyces sp. CA-294286 TaxID=3240070 RepID=UPI003D8BF29D
MTDHASSPSPAPAAAGSRVAFVLGGGGALGGYQAGMVRALLARGVVPQVVIGTSIGSVQGAMIARNPTPSVCEELEDFWRAFVADRAMRLTPRSLLNAMALRPALNSPDVVRRILTARLGATTRIEDLAVPYQCTAASIERATVRYFDSGPLVPAVLASSAVPGLWPPVRIGQEHYVDGGVAESVPITRAIACGATTVYVLRMRQKEKALKPARFPWQLGSTIFELSRRHTLHHVLNNRPPGVTVHVLPSGEELMEPPDNGAWTSKREELATIHRRAESGYRATNRYLDDLESRRPVAPRRSALSVAAVPGPLTAFVAGKLRAHFDVFDADGDGSVTAADFHRTAARIADAFGHPSGSAHVAALHGAFAAYWAGLTARTAASRAGVDGAGDRTGAGATGPGEEGPGTLDRDAFGAALARLCVTPAAYDEHLLPVVSAILSAADQDNDGFLNSAETRNLLHALGVAEGDSTAVARRLDTNGDGVTSLDELAEAFHDYFTSDEPGCVGNLLFGGGR